MLIECFEGIDSWVEPRDLYGIDIEGFLRRDSNQSGHVAGRRAVLFASGSVDFLYNDTPPKVLRAMLTIAGGEELEQVKDDKGRLVWRLKNSPKNRELGLIPDLPSESMNK